MRNIPAGLLPIIEAPINSPVELYELYLDAGTFFFAVHDQPVVFAGTTYEPLGVRRAAIETHLSEQVDSITVGLDDVNNRLAQLIASVEFRARRCRILKVFLESLNDPTHYIVLFDGRMDSPMVDDRKFSVRVVSYLDLLHREYPGRVFSTLCNYKLYDAWCTVDRNDPANKVMGTVDAGSTAKKLIAAELTQVDDYWQIGTIQFTMGINAGIGREVLKSIQGDTSVEVRVSFPNTPSIGDAFEIVRGCNKTEDDCVTKFDNWPNYGGFNHIPQPILPLTPIAAGGGGKGGGK